MAFDYKKEYKEFYLPKNTPQIVNVPSMNFIAVRGRGNPNLPDGEYSRALNVLYSVAYTLKMSKMTDRRIDGYFDYIVPPLEGFWWQDDKIGFDYVNKDSFCWISVIRLPDFITKDDFDWAVKTATEKKKIDCSKAEFLPLQEGLCVQCMHIGPFDSEPETVARMHEFIEQSGYSVDLGTRKHHEIYLSDFRKTAPEKLKTVLRIPIQ